MTDQQILIGAIEKAGVIIAEHIDPRITSDPEQTMNRLIAVLDTREVAGAIARRGATPDGFLMRLPARHCSGSVASVGNAEIGPRRPAFCDMLSAKQRTGGNDDSSDRKADSEYR
jgi:hypothetical protein